MDSIELHQGYEVVQAGLGVISVSFAIESDILSRNMEKPETQETNQIAPMDQDTLQEAFEVGLKVLLSTWPTLIMAVRI